MDPMDLFPWLLFAHIFGAVVAFGPTFVFPLIGAMGGKEPMHANFATRVSFAISKKVTWPLALLQGVTGLGMILVAEIDLREKVWLGVAIVIYVAALAFSHWVQTPRVAAVIEMTSTPPPPPAPGATPSGPPPALLAKIKAIQQGGKILTLMLASIFFLMIVKPGA